MSLWQLFLAVCHSMTSYVTLESASLYDTYHRDGKQKSLRSIDQLCQKTNNLTQYDNNVS